jgi:hypothetical protein
VEVSDSGKHSSLLRLGFKNKRFYSQGFLKVFLEEKNQKNLLLFPKKMQLEVFLNDLKKSKIGQIIPKEK